MLRLHQHVFNGTSERPTAFAAARDTFHVISHENNNITHDVCYFWVIFFGLFCILIYLCFYIDSVL